MARGTKASKPPKPQTRQAKGGRKTKGAEKWWAEAEEVPRAGLPDAAALEKRGKRLRRVVWATVFLCPLALLTTFVAVANVGNANGPAAVQADAYAATRAQAMLAVRKWLDSEPAPLPGGALIGWDKATSAKSPKDEQNPEEEYVVETHYLTIVGADATLYTTTVPIGVSDLHGAVVLGEPTLLPKPPGDIGWTPSPWPTLNPANPTDDIETAINTWAEAYTSGDPAKLLQAVRDNSGQRSYMPLRGATFVETIIRDAASFPGENGETIERPSVMVVNVLFPVRWAGDTVTPDNDLPSVTFDLLVKDADTSAPYVVAWGGSGTGPTLKQFETNGIEFLELQAADPDAPIPTDGLSDETDTSGSSDEITPAEPTDPDTSPSDAATDEPGKGKGKGKKKDKKGDR